MPEMLLRQPRFIHIARGPLTKNKQRTQKFKETGDSRYICQKSLNKACFRHEKAYRDFRDLARRTASDKVLRDKVFKIAKSPKCDEYQSELASMVFRFFDKKSVFLADKAIFVSPGKSEIMSNQQLAEQLHKPIIRKFEKRKYTNFLQTTFGVLSSQYATNR